MGVSLAVASVVIGAISLEQQYEAGNKAAGSAKQAAAAQKESQAAQGRMAEVEAQRARIAQVREARIRRAQIIGSTTNLGPGTSGVSGATGSVTSQESSNIGLINQTQTFAQQATAANQRAADASSAMVEAQQKGAQWQTINTIFGASRTDLTTVFGGNKIPKAGGNT